MRLSIFSFRTVLNTVYAVLALGLGTLLVLFSTAEGRQKILQIEPERFSQAIRENTPDLVLVGNSLLYENIDGVQLESILQQHLNRKIHVQLVALGGTPCAWWYLTLKNTVIPNIGKDTRVGLFFDDFSLTDFHTSLTDLQRWQIQKILGTDEPVFFEKTGGRFQRDTDLNKHLPDRRDIREFLLRLWTDAWLRVTGHRRADASALLEARFRLHNQKPFEKMNLRETKNPPPETSTPCRNLSACIAKTFLPDIVEIMKDRPFFMVEVHPRPDTVPAGEWPRYRKDLETYLTQQGVPLVTLAHQPALKHLGLYTQGAHLTPEGRSINTRAFAEALIKSNLFS